MHGATITIWFIGFFRCADVSMVLVDHLLLAFVFSFTCSLTSDVTICCAALGHAVSES